MYSENDFDINELLSDDNIPPSTVNNNNHISLPSDGGESVSVAGNAEEPPEEGSPFRTPPSTMTDNSSDKHNSAHEEPIIPPEVGNSNQIGHTIDNAQLDEAMASGEFEVGKYEALLTKMHSELLSVKDIPELNELKLSHLKQLSVARIELLPKPYIPTQANKPPARPFTLSFIDKGVIYQLMPQGGMGAIVGSPGTGKSSLIGAIIGSHENPESDSFGFKTYCEGKIAVVDTEIDSDSLWEYMDRTRRRAGVEELLKSFYAGVDHFSTQDKLIYVEKLFEDEEIKLIIIDGIGDLCPDVNNTSDSFKLIDNIRQRCSKTKTSCIVTLHDNPVASKGAFAGKSRGHLGSEISRRADFCVYLKYDKDTKITSITPDFVSGKCRHCSSDFEGLIQWDKNLGMHVSVDSTKAQETLSVREEESLKTIIRMEHPEWTRTELRDAIFDNNISSTKEGARKMVARWVEKGFMIENSKKKLIPNGSVILDEIDLSNE
jgi:hypothetical protein